MTCSKVGLVTQKKDGNCVAVLRDRMFILSISFSSVSDDSGSFFRMPSDHVAGSYIANQTKFSEKNQQIQTSPDRITYFFFLQFLHYFNP